MKINGKQSNDRKIYGMLSILTYSGLNSSFTGSKFLIPSPILTFFQTITNNIKTKTKEENNLTNKQTQCNK
jgi:hypothetical protein